MLPFAPNGRRPCCKDDKRLKPRQLLSGALAETKIGMISDGDGHKDESDVRGKAVWTTSHMVCMDGHRIDAY
eukprot:8913878-Alexandrium_andersonii.AAC.1